MLNKLQFNNLVITNKKLIQQARAQTIAKLVKKLRKLKDALEKQPDNDKHKERLRKNVECMAQLKALKQIDIMRSLLLQDNLKHNAVVANARATPDEIAIALLGLNKIMQGLLTKFQETLSLSSAADADWRNEILETSKRRLKLERTEDKRRKRKENKEQKAQTRNRLEWLELNKPGADQAPEATETETSDIRTAIDTNGTRTQIETNAISTAAGVCLVESMEAAEPAAAKVAKNKSHDKPKREPKPPKTNQLQVAKREPKTPRPDQSLAAKRESKTPKPDQFQAAKREPKTPKPDQLQTNQQITLKLEPKATKTDQLQASKPELSKREDKQQMAHENSKRPETEQRKKQLNPKPNKPEIEKRLKQLSPQPKKPKKAEKERPTHVIDPFFITESGQPYLSTAVVMSDDSQHETDDDNEQQQQLEQRRRKPMAKWQEHKNMRANEEQPSWLAKRQEHNDKHPSWLAKQQQKPIITNFKGKKIKFGDDGSAAVTTVAAAAPVAAVAESTEAGMHPSWIAKQRLKPKIAAFTGTKIKFDDD